MNGDRAGRVCTTIDCGFPATVRGIFDDGDNRYEDVDYCDDCARVMRSEFTVTAWLVDPPIPGAPSSPGTEQVREELARWNWDRAGEPDALSFEMADEILALPAMRQLLDAEAAVQRVRALHVHDGFGWCRYCGEFSDGDSEGLWPCGTTRALDGA